MKITKRFRSQKGTVAPLAAVALGTALAMTALGVDVGYIFRVHGEAQMAADAAALASLLPGPPVDAAKAVTAARDFAAQRRVGGAPGFLSAVDLGNYNFVTNTFTPGGAPINASRVTAARAGAVNAPAGNPGALPLFFARVFGIPTAAISATATAVLDPRVVANQGKNWTEPLGVRNTLVDTNGDGVPDIGTFVDLRQQLSLPPGGRGVSFLNLNTACWDMTQPGCSLTAPSSNTVLTDYIANGFDKAYGVPVGGSAPTQAVPGDRAASLDPAFTALIAAQEDGVSTNCTQQCTDFSQLYMTCLGYTGVCDNTTLTPGLVGIYPVWDSYVLQGSNATYNVIGLVAMRIISVNLTADPNMRSIKAQVLPLVSSEFIIDENAPASSTMFKLRLVRNN